jgi:hypothetical protein
VARIPSKMDAVATEKAEDRKPGAHWLSIRVFRIGFQFALQERNAPDKKQAKTGLRPQKKQKHRLSYWKKKQLECSRKQSLQRLRKRKWMVKASSSIRLSRYLREPSCRSKAVPYSEMEGQRYEAAQVYHSQTSEVDRT